VERDPLYPGTYRHGKSWRYEFEADRKRIRKGGFATQREAWLAMEKRRDNPQIAKDNKVRFGRYWKHTFRPRLEQRIKAGRFSQNTLDSYDSIYKVHVEDELGIKRLQNFSVATVKAYMEDLAEKTYVRGGKERPYSQDHQLSCFNFLSSVFSEAVHDEVMAFNPCHNIKYKPRTTRRKIRTLGSREINLLLEAALEYQRFGTLRWKTMIGLIIFTGCRRQDCVAIRWSDVDFKTRKLSLWIDTDENGKTEASARKIDIPEKLITLLAAWKLEAEFALPSDYVFATDRRKALNKHCVNRAVRRIREIAIKGLDPKLDRESIEILAEFIPHAGRHNWASLQISSKVDAQRLADQGGWANAKVPMQIYAQEFKDARQDRSTARNVDEIYADVTL